jgi:hypothetical protein
MLGFNNNKKQEIEKQKALDKQNYYLVKSFIESEFYKNVFLPFLENRKKDLANGMIWRGQPLGTNEIASGCLYNSGRIAQIEDILSQLDIMIEKGEQILKEEEKNGG